MRILIPILFFAACGDRELSDADPCTKAVANAERLIKEDPGARRRFGVRPLRPQECQRATAQEITCISYASSWPELEACSPTVLGTR